MKLYYEDKDISLYEGKMQDVLDTLPDNSIDSIVCDPPYDLTALTKRRGKETKLGVSEGTQYGRLAKGFMGKTWDATGVAFDVETWEKALRVLKPGGYLLAFGGTRTFHRMAVAIEDAGFEIRDCIMWLYGCLSNDTEILTSNGWKNSETISINDEIYSLDLCKNTIVKNKVKNVFKYDYDGEMVNIKNNNTNQLLTPNHHCIVNDKIRTRAKEQTNYQSHDYWYYKDAWQVRSETTKIPLSSTYDGSLKIGNLFAELLGLVISEGTYLKDTNAIMITQSSANKNYVSRIRYILGKLKIKYSEYRRERVYKDRTYIEYDFYIGKESEEVVNKIKDLAPNKKLTYKLLELSLTNKEFLLKGLCEDDGAKAPKNKFGFSAFYQNDLEELKVFQTLLHLTNKQGRINEKKHSCQIHSNPTTELQGKHYKNRFVKYDGKFVWCIETEIGNFIAKRDGKIFITGNSGFPKSLNVGYAIDKLSEKEKSNIYNKQNWESYGTALKPAFEPIIMARKPIEDSVARNCLKYGVGAINIDECRVYGEEKITSHNTEAGTFAGRTQTMPKFKSKLSFGQYEEKAERIEYTQHEGRFPANVITDGSDEVAAGMPNTKSEGGCSMKNSMFGLSQEVEDYNFHDEGSAMRYFYQAKASKKDRDEGLLEFEKMYYLREDTPQEIIEEIRRLLEK